MLVIESAVAGRLDGVSDWMSFTWRHAAHASAGPAKRAQILLLGDSLVKGGVLPVLLESELGVSAYNLSVHGGTAPSSYFLLRRALDAGARPGAVVVDFHPNLLAVAPRSNSQWADLLGPLDALDLACTARDPALAVRTWLDRALPTVRHRVEVRAALLALLGGQTPLARRLNRTLARNYEVNKGARLLDARPDPGDLNRSFVPITEKKRWSPHRANLAYMERLFDLAERSGAAVYWLLPPTSAAWEARRRLLNAEPDYEALIRTFERRHPRLRVIDGRAAGYPNTVFKDLTHVHSVGAAELTRGIALILRSDRAEAHGLSTAWLRLPAFRGRAVPDALEDLEESRIALEGPGGTRFE